MISMTCKMLLINDHTCSLVQKEDGGRSMQVQLNFYGLDCDLNYTQYTNDNNEQLDLCWDLDRVVSKWPSGFTLVVWAFQNGCWYSSRISIRKFSIYLFFLSIFQIRINLVVGLVHIGLSQHNILFKLTETVLFYNVVNHLLSPPYTVLFYQFSPSLIIVLSQSRSLPLCSPFLNLMKRNLSQEPLRKILKGYKKPEILKTRSSLHKLQSHVQFPL